jgi:L-asparaginase II
VQRLANVYRGSQIESFHTGSIAVVDALGRLLAYAGDPGLHTYLRSAAKPFQGIPLLEYGGIDEYELTGEEIALTCASHRGEAVHVSTAAALLRKGEFDEDDLLCGAHWPYDEKSANDLRAAGEQPSPLHNNCSGKHAGMLLATQLMDVPSSRYIDADHPLQALMRSTVAEFAGLEPDELPTATDGCGVPTFFLSLHRTAYAYARLMASSEGSAAPGALERYSGSASHVVEAMTTFPYYVAGAGSITTPLMESFGGELLGKEGAEGFYALAISPSLRSELSDRVKVAEDVAIGIAIKVHDGTADRARYPAILRTLEALGINVSARRALPKYREWEVRNHAGTLVGDVRAEFDLEFV